MRDADAVDVDLPRLLAVLAGCVMSGGAIDDDFVVAGLVGQRFVVLVGRRHVVGRRDRVVLARLVDLHRLAVEVRIGEVVGRPPEVDEGEVELLGVLVDAGAAADDLLELGHRADLAVEHDQAAGLGVDAGGEQARGGDDDRDTSTSGSMKLPSCACPSVSSPVMRMT